MKLTPVQQVLFNEKLIKAAQFNDEIFNLCQTIIDYVEDQNAAKTGVAGREKISTQDIHISLHNAGRGIFGGVHKV